jgi:hypothetical protein
MWLLARHVKNSRGITFCTFRLLTKIDIVRKAAVPKCNLLASS